MKTWITIFAIMVFIVQVQAQELRGKIDFKEETMAFLKVLNAGDSLGIRSFFYEDAEVFHVEDGVLEGMSINDFMTVAKKFESRHFQENFVDVKVQDYENGLVYTDVTFHFFIDGEMAFVGVDHCLWLNKGNGYKIDRLYSSVLAPKIQTNPMVIPTEKMLNKLLDQWHLDAAQTNFDAYFGFMDEGFIFLGTDPKERWNKEAFSVFCKPYFDKGKAWTFTANWRNWYFSEDGKTAWFEESLNTQMDECRGSGVITFVDGNWKIAHYNLTVLIENEKMKKFLKLRRK